MCGTVHPNESDVGDCTAQNTVFFFLGVVAESCFDWPVRGQDDASSVKVRQA